MSARHPAELTAALVEALMRGAVSKSELCDAMGLDRSRSEILGRHLAPFRKNGRARICRWDSCTSARYEWQDPPFALPDAPRPVKAETVRRDVAKRRLAAESLRAALLPEPDMVAIRDRLMASLGRGCGAMVSA